MRGDLEAITAALAAHGLIPRGGFDFEEDEDAPAGPRGKPAKSVLLVGQSGAEPWRHFQQWRKNQPAVLENPLDSWAREVIGEVAEKFGARAASPSDRPYLPFQQWVMRAEGLKPSPLGILMHPEYGLWHAYRGALLFEERVGFSGKRNAEPPLHLCDFCAEKPCLNACPVGAYSAAGFAHQACLAHVRSAAGATCRDSGCLARNACPHGTAYRYPAEVQAFHMAAFAGGTAGIS
jgi:hypothetical protein